VRRVALRPDDTAWSVCNDAGVSLAELSEANKGIDIESLKPGDVVRVPEVLALHAFQDKRLGGRLLDSEEVDEAAGATAAAARARDRRWHGSDKRGLGMGGSGWSDDGWTSGSTEELDHGSNGAVVADYSCSSNGSGGGGFLGLGRLLGGLSRFTGGGGSGSVNRALAEVEERPITTPAAAAVAHAVAIGSVPRSGLVAVKVQYPDALRVMSEDLVNLRAISAFLSKTEIKFDLVSAVDELQKQIHLEFDFMR